MSHTALDLINTELYPLHDHQSSSYNSLVKRCKEELATHSACLLEGFITSDAIEMIVSEVDRASIEAYGCRETHNVFLEKNDKKYPLTHPRRQLQNTNLDSVAFDQIHPTHGLHILYSWDPLLSFIANVLNKENYYRMADPLAAVKVNVMHDGQNHGWHFDEAAVSTTIMLQSPKIGGVFEYVPNIRPEETGGYEAIDQVLKGSYKDIRTLKVTPGTLILFEGYRSLHQVTTVRGATTRYVATFCYKDQPNICNSPEVQKIFYGRTV